MYHPSVSKRSNTAPSRFLVMLAAFAFLLLVSAACAPPATESFLQTFIVEPGTQIDVDNFNGQVRVDAGLAGVVRFEAKITRPKHVEYELHQDGNVVTFESDLTSSFTTGASPEVDIVITVPADAELDIRTGNGRIEVFGSRGSGQMNTGNGRLTLNDVQGDFTGISGNGRVTLSDVSGSFHLSTGNGDINISSGDGTFAMNTGSGDIDISDADGTLDINSGNGSIDLDDVDVSVRASTGNGKINFSGRLSDESDNILSSGNGRIDVRFTNTPDISLDAETKRGKIVNDLDLDAVTLSQDRHLIGTIGDGTIDLEIAAGNGDIVLR